MFNIYFTVYISKSQLQPDEIIQYNQQKFIVMRVICGGPLLRATQTVSLRRGLAAPSTPSREGVLAMQRRRWICRSCPLVRSLLVRVRQC